MTTTYMYGACVLHDGINYFLTEKPLDFPVFKQTYFQVGRLEGVKKSGERLNERQIAVTIKVVGASRVDLEYKLDTLYQGLSARQQSLTLHSEDARYYIADAVAGQARLVPGRILAVDVPVTFVCQQPFAYASSQSVRTWASLLMSAVSGQANVWQLPSASNPLSVSGGGNYFARPTIILTNETTANATTLSSTVSSGTAYTTLSVAALPAAAAAGRVFLLVSAGGSYQLQR
jgi:hypothetical protein